MLRVEAKIEVEFKNFDQFYKEYTKNISKGGMFIKTNKVLKPQTVIEIFLKLPNVDQPLDLVGEVVHAIEPELAKQNNWEAGMGIHFVDFEEEAQKVLHDYVATQYHKDPAARPRDRRQHPRTDSRLRVKFPSLDVLQHDYSEDISRGGIFIQTPKPREVGDRFLITLVHPETGEELELLGEVVRITHQDPKVPGSLSGMGIRFLEMDEKKHQAIEKFLGLDFPADEI